MRGLSLIHFAVAAMVTAALSGSPPARAQSLQTWVASNGMSTTCTRGAPCSSFQAAYTATSFGGEITCVDSGVFGGLTITHSITINCNGTNGTADGAVFNINTSVTDVVVLRGLDFDGDGQTTNGGQAGFIIFNGAGTLHVEKTTFNSIKGDRNSGIFFTPSGPAKLLVVDSTITNIGTAGTAAGIYIKPSAGVAADISIQRSRIDANFFGIIADGTGGGIIRGIVSDSFVTDNRNNGITVSTSGSSTVLTVDNTRVSGNVFGLAAGGASAGLLVRRSIINGNATGLFSTGGGALLSYRDNSVNANTTTDGAFTGIVNLQ
jgi:hypothetical protein